MIVEHILLHVITTHPLLIIPHSGYYLSYYYPFTLLSFPCASTSSLFSSSLLSSRSPLKVIRWWCECSMQQQVCHLGIRWRVHWSCWTGLTGSISVTSTDGGYNVSNLNFLVMTHYTNLSAADHHFELIEKNETIATDSIQESTVATLLIAGTYQNAPLIFLHLTDDITLLESQGKIRFVHLLPGAPAVDIGVSELELA